MPKREFKKGDRVKMVGVAWNITTQSYIFLDGDKGSVVETQSKDQLKVKSGPLEFSLHRRQCIPLTKPKKKPERRSGTVGIDRHNKIVIDRACFGLSKAGDHIELIELRPGEVIVSYEGLAKAWDATVDGVLSEHSSHFKALTKCLGLSPESKGEK